MTPAARRSRAKPKPTQAVGKGSPRRLWFSLPEDQAQDLDPTAPIEATLKGAQVSSVSLAGALGIGTSGPRIKVRVDPLTPPGRYEGTATIGETKIPIVAEVEPSTRVHTDPAMVEVAVAPGETVDVTVTLENRGNVPTGVPAKTTFPLLDRSGFGDAFYHAIGSKPPEGKERIDVFFDDLAGNFGGEVTATAVTDTGGPIEPGQTGTITLTLAFPKRLQRGAEYAGSWNIDATHVPVRVKVPAIKEEATA